MLSLPISFVYETLGIEKIPEEVILDEIFIDSRKSNSENGLFVAIRGLHHDGHDFVDELIGKGGRFFIVDEKFEVEDRNAHFIVVPNTLHAFQNIAAAFRKTFKGKVVAVTGSNGKTIVKEWLSQLLLSAGFRVSKSPKSYYSQVGVPLSVLRANPNDDYFIFEAGISTTGEMERLEQVLTPDAAILTNIGSAHDQGFDDREEKIREKLILAKRLSRVQAPPSLVSDVSHSYSWSASDLSNPNGEGSALTIAGESYFLPFGDSASVENAMHCICFGLDQDIAPAVIREWILELRPVATRLELKAGTQNTRILSDYYNNDQAGFLMALEYTHSLSIKEGKVLILSDISDVEGNTKRSYQEIQKAILKEGFERVIAIGPVCSGLQSELLPWETYASTESFLEQVNFDSFSDQFILLKGARYFAFERIEERLVRSVHKTRFEINLSTLERNLNHYREQLSSGTKLMVMVKAFAYGSGDIEVARLLEYTKVDYLAVAYTDEGVALRNAGISLPIMVMNSDPYDTDRLRKFNLEPEVYSLHKFTDFIDRYSGLKIHLKLDTGMHRLGFEEDDLDELALLLNKSEIEVASVFSHLVGTDSKKLDGFTLAQIDLFESMYGQIVKNMPNAPLKHILNSSGISRFAEAHFDMVRLGIGLYGFGSATQGKTEQIGTLIATVSQIRKVKAGESVGYSRSQILDRDSRIATISIGYADGYDRRFGNGIGEMLVNGSLCPIVGSVCMDMTMIDVSGVEVEEGDEVIVYGGGLDVETLAEKIGTISYELLTSVGQRIPRVFYSE